MKHFSPCFLSLPPKICILDPLAPPTHIFDNVLNMQNLLRTCPKIFVRASQFCQTTEENVKLKNDQKHVDICSHYGHHMSISSNEAEPNLVTVLSLTFIHKMLVLLYIQLPTPLNEMTHPLARV